ncbi:hypothetical protein D3C78_190750 [compost metagenome]
MSRYMPEPEGFFWGALKIALGVFIGALAAMFAYEYILGLRLEGRLTSAFSKPAARTGLVPFGRPYHVEIEVPRPTVGEIQWSDDPDSKKIIKR